MSDDERIRNELRPKLRVSGLNLDILPYIKLKKGFTQIKIKVWFTNPEEK